ncbi:MAG TPA: hypothetical protein VIP11_21750, partial [Gemmatimonadaceae bacterium]
MMRNRSQLLALATAVLMIGSPGRASGQADNDSSTAVATAQRLLDAINKADTALARSLLLPGSQFISFRLGAATPRVMPDSAFVRSLAARREKNLERMWAPIVHVAGSIATVWAPYDFYIDGRFSHCGIDTFTMMKTPKGWSIVSVAYSVEPYGCP